MARSKSEVPHWNQDLGPLFRKEQFDVDRQDFLDWVRRELLRSGLVRFSAEDVREIVERKRPHWMQSGHWLGRTFAHHWFVYREHVIAERPEAKGRMIMSYSLSEDGIAARDNLLRTETKRPNAAGPGDAVL